MRHANPKKGTVLAAGFSLALFLSCACLSFAADPAQLPKYRIALLKDGSCEYFDNLTKMIVEELLALTTNQYDVEIRDAAVFNADWQPEKINSILEQALSDPEIDLVLAAGAIFAEAAAQPECVLNKPVVSACVQDADTAGMPYDAAGVSTKTNYNFVVTPLRVARDLEVFHKLASFRNLAIVADTVLLTNLEGVTNQVSAIAKQLQVNIMLVPANSSASETAALIPAAADAVYLTPALRMSREEWRKLIAAINQRKLPSFSMMGHVDVRRGVLAGLAPPADERIARRVALNIKQIMAGIPPEELPVFMPIEEKLVLNETTAAAIGYAPPIAVMIEADFVEPAALSSNVPTLTMADALQLATAHNIEIAIKRADVILRRQESRQALSGLLPQADAYLAYQRVDRDQAKASFGMQPLEQQRGGINITQVLYSDALISRYRAARELWTGSQYEYNEMVLDVIQAAAAAFLNCLQAEALFAVEKDNLLLTMNNLDAAKVRRQAGAAGPEEVLRWETQAAMQKARVIAASSEIDRARVALNHVLGLPLDRRWQFAAVNLDGKKFHFLEGRLDALLLDQKALEKLEDFSVAFGLRQAPLLQALDRSIAAQEIILHQTRRRFFLPSANAEFNYGHVFDKETEASTVPLPMEETTKDDEWKFTLQAALPLFEGGRNRAELTQARVQLDQYRQMRTRSARLIEQSIRQAMYALHSSYPNLQLQRTAADFASKNLEAIKDKYQRGTVSILELLDAQTQAFNAQQNATLAAYRYLQDTYNMQRAISWFEWDKSTEEKDAWINAFREFCE